MKYRLVQDIENKNVFYLGNSADWTSSVIKKRDIPLIIDMLMEARIKSKNSTSPILIEGGR